MGNAHETPHDKPHSNATRPHFLNRSGICETVSRLCAHPATLLRLVCALLVIMTLEIVVFNMGTWLSPSSDSAITCDITDASHASGTDACQYTLQNVSYTSASTSSHSDSASDSTPGSTGVRENGVRVTGVTVTGIDAKLTISLPRGTRITTIQFSPSSASSTSYFTPVTVDAQQVTLRSDRPTFAFLSSEVTDTIAREGKLTLAFPNTPQASVSSNSTAQTDSTQADSAQADSEQTSSAQATTSTQTTDSTQAADSAQSASPYTVSLQSITLNARKPFYISIVRVLAMLLILCFLWGLRPRSRLYTIELDTHSRAQQCAFWLCIVLPLSILALVNINAAGIFVGDDTWAQSGNYVYSYHHYILASQGILEGHPWVNLPVDPAFDALSNPFDPQARNALLSNGSQIFWDYAFYNHHWYSYFGVLPSLLIYIPFHALTGQWPSIFTVIIPLLALSIIMMMATVIRFIHRYFPRASVGHTIPALITVFIGMNFIQLLLVTNLYAIAFVSALSVCSIGIFIWLKVSPENSWWHNACRMAVGSLCIALSSACRPTFVFMAILVAPIFLELVWKKPMRRIIASTAVCLASAAAGLTPALWYNWWRFGSIFDFGSRYQITVTDIMHLHATGQATAQGTLYYLFRPLELSSNPPFIESPVIVTSTWIHRETFIAGLFVLVPVVLIALLLSLTPPLARRLSQRFLWIYPVLGTIIGTFLCIFITRSGGVAWRYVADFAWAFTWAALPALLIMLTQAHSRMIQSNSLLARWVTRAIVWMTLYEIIILVATAFIPNRFASFVEYAPQLYATISDALTIL